MLPLLPLAPSVGLAALLVSIALPSALWLARAGRERRVITLGFACLALALIGGAVAWKFGLVLGVVVLWTAIPILALVVISLPLAFALRIASSISERKRGASAGPKLSRRAALAIPLGVGSVGALGFSKAFAPAELRSLELEHGGLHPDLDGLKILQLSDLHLGIGLSPRDLAALVAELSASRPDLVVLTGDVADRTDALEQSLPILSALRPRYGTFAVLGNHEYLSGACHEMRAIYAASEVRLLVDRSETLRIGRARLELLGIDDPLGRPGPNPFIHSLAALGVDSGADFRLLLSHRPEAFAFAARRGIELTLAGHTHGFQVGWLGRSLLERLGKTRWAWGWYRLGQSALYTSAGAGDWFPFRLGCPREAPLIVLRKT